VTVYEHQSSLVVTSHGVVTSCLSMPYRTPEDSNLQAYIFFLKINFVFFTGYLILLELIGLWVFDKTGHKPGIESNCRRVTSCERPVWEPERCSDVTV